MDGFGSKSKHVGAVRDLYHAFGHVGPWMALLLADQNLDDIVEVHTVSCVLLAIQDSAHASNQTPFPCSKSKHEIVLF